MLLEGKIALVTGAAGGIGKACALNLAAEGAWVGVADIRSDVAQTAAEITGSGGKSLAVTLDIAEPQQVEKGVEAIRRELGGIGILVNNAGIVNNISPLIEMSHQAWVREIDTNLTGAFNMIGQVIPGMVARRWGRIINMSSIGAAGGLHRQAAYAASKAGLLGLTKTVTLEHAIDGITCNAILPGMIATEKVKKMPREIKRRLIAATPAGRFGEVEEIAHLVAFLASDRAAYINGAELNIDGGWRLNSVSLGSRKANLKL